MTFEIEKQTYEQHRKEWLRKGLAGRFAVIKGHEVFGNSFTTFEDAYTFGAKTLGGEFLVQPISDGDELQIIQRCSWPALT